MIRDRRRAAPATLLVAGLGVVTVVFGGDISPGPTQQRPGRAPITPSGGAARLWPVPGRMVQACRRAQAHASFVVLCPARLPRATQGDLPWDSPSPLEVTRSRGDLDFSYNAEAAGLGVAQTLALDRPSRFLHFVIGLATQGVPPGARRARLGGHWGRLATASSVENYAGPYFANHVRFTWRQHGVEYVATLHTFGVRPTTALLGRIVANLVPADKLAATDQRLASAPVGPGPAAIAANASGVWVGTRGDFASDLNGRLVQINPVTMRAGVRALIPPKGIRVAVGDDAVWALSNEVTPDGQGLTPPQLTRIDPATGRATGRLGLGPGEATSIAVETGHIWVAMVASDPQGSGTVLRVDPATMHVQTRTLVGRGTASLAVGGGSVWAVNARSNTVSRLDARTGRLAATVTVGGHPGAVTVNLGSAWVTNVNDGTVSRIDPRTDRVTATISVGPAPYGVTADSRGVWVAVLGSGALVRIDPKANRITARVNVHGDPLAIATDGRRLFVTLNDDAQVLRLTDPERSQ